MQLWRVLPMRVRILFLVVAMVVGWRIVSRLHIAISWPASHEPTSHDGPTLDLPFLSADLKPAVQNKAPVEEAADRPITYRVGGPDRNGNVLFAEWDDRATIYLLTDYGFMLVNGGTYDKPKPVYLLGNLRRKRVTDFHSVSALARALRRIPRGTRVPDYTVCTAGTAPGVGAGTWQKVKRAFRRAGLRFDPDNYRAMYDICLGSDPLPDVYPEMKPAFVRVYGKAAYESHRRKQ